MDGREEIPRMRRESADITWRCQGNERLTSLKVMSQRDLATPSCYNRPFEISPQISPSNLPLVHVPELLCPTATTVPFPELQISRRAQ